MLVASCGKELRVHKLLSGTNGLESFDGYGSNTKEPKLRSLPCLSFNHNGKALFCSNGNSVSLYIKGKGKSAEYPLPADQSGETTALAVGPDSRYLVTGAEDGVVRLWDLKKHVTIKNLYIHTTGGKVTSVAISNDGTAICSATTSGQIILFNLQTMSRSAVIGGGEVLFSQNMRQRNKINEDRNFPAVRAIQYSKTRKHLFAACMDNGSVIVYDSTSLKTYCCFSKLHLAPAVDLCFSPLHSGLLVSVGLDKVINFVDIDKSSIVASISAEYPLSSVSCAPTGEVIVAGTTNGNLLVYNLSKIAKEKNWKPTQVIQCHIPNEVNCVNFYVPVNRGTAKVAEKRQTTAAIKQKSIPTKQMQMNDLRKPVLEKSRPISLAKEEASMKNLLFSPPLSVKKSIKAKRTDDNNQASILPRFETLSKTKFDQPSFTKLKEQKEENSTISMSDSVSTILPPRSSFSSVTPAVKLSVNSVNEKENIMLSNVIESPQKAAGGTFPECPQKISEKAMSEIKEGILCSLRQEIEQSTKEILYTLREERREERKELELLLLRQFRIQMTDISKSFHALSEKFSKLEEENEKLKQENIRLSKLF